MLGKLLKYEFKATARMFLPLYAALVVFAIINRMFLEINAEEFAYGLPAAIAMTVYFLIIAAICAATLLVSIQRFYKNLLGDEGYLMFTLPVTTSMHITAKTIASVIWTLVSGVVTLLSIFIIASKFKFIEIFQDVIQAFIKASQFYGANMFFWSVEAILAGILSIVSGVLIVYLCIAVGHLAKKHKILTSFGCYIAITTILQIIITVAAIVWSETPLCDWILTNVSELGLTHLFLSCYIVFNLVAGAVSFFITNKILTHKLNLE